MRNSLGTRYLERMLSMRCGLGKEGLVPIMGKEVLVQVVGKKTVYKVLGKKSCYRVWLKRLDTKCGEIILGSRC